MNKSITREIAEKIIGESICTHGPGAECSEYHEEDITNRIDTALRQRESEVRAEAWQPIETAPINERILVIYPTGEGGEIHIATLADYQISGSTQNWLSSSWAIHGIGTHVIPISWQPLPAIRRDSEAQEGE